MSRVTTNLVTELASKYAKSLDESMVKALIIPTPKVKPLSNWEKIKRFMTKRRSVGIWLTHKLMQHYDIYEDTY